MASFVTAMSGWTPKMYYELTMEERNAIVKQMNKRK